MIYTADFQDDSEEAEITFGPTLQSPTSPASICDITDTPMSLYQPCEASFTSTVTCTGETTTISAPREKLNAFLTSRDVSPVRYPLSTPWEDASDRTKRYHARKAHQVVTACLEEIAPGQSPALLESLSKAKFEKDSSIDFSLLDALSECYNNTSHWSTHRQILSIMADKVSFKQLQKWIPNLSRYRFNVARHHLLLHGRGSVLPSLKNTRIYVEPGKIEHFVSFITSSHIIQDLPFGEKTLKLSSDVEIRIPNIVRNLIPEQVILFASTKVIVVKLISNQ